MPYDNVPEDKWDEMDKCVISVMEQGKDKDSAIAICHASIVEGKALPDGLTFLYAKGGDPISTKSDQDIINASRQMLREIDNNLASLSKEPSPDEPQEDEPQLDPEKTFVAFGGEVKATVLEDGRVRVGGYLVRFTDEDTPDLYGDYFTAKTDFGFDPGEEAMVPVYFHHGQPLETRSGDPITIKKRIGRGRLSLDDKGVLIDAILYNREEYEKAIAETIKSLGWSSGALNYMVDRQPGKKANRITQWSIGEGSLTPTPAEPRNMAVPLKSLIPAPEAVVSTAAADQNPVKFVYANGEKTMDENEVKTLVRETVDSAVAALESKIPQLIEAKRAPGFNKTGLGDNEIKAYCHFVRTGDRAAMGWTKASNDTDMNIGTAADGGDLVPTGHYQGIIAKRDEQMLATKLGVMPIPGKGTTVNVPYDNEADGEFVATNEANDFDRDAPALAKKAMTLVLYSKQIQISYQLLEDEDSRLMSFLDNFVGRGMAKTHNNLLITEVGTNGTSLKTFASATAYAQGEFEPMIYNAAMVDYLDDSPSVAWVTSGPNFSKIQSIKGSTPFAYQDATGVVPIKGGAVRPGLLNFPVHFSNKVTAVAASAKSIYFGNWSYVGLREAPNFSVLRDPYSLAHQGQIALYYYFRAVYSVLQAEAVGYGVHPTA